MSRQTIFTKNEGDMDGQIIEYEINPFIQLLSEFEQSSIGELETFSESIQRFAKTVDEIILKDGKNRILNKERFSVFSCLTKHHLEELHTGFLLYLLNPNGTHDCGSLFLSSFVDLLTQDESIKQSRYFNTFQNLLANKELANAIVRREWHIGYSNESDIYGRMDIFLETKCMNIVIENKTAMGAPSRQVERYIDHCEKLKKPYLVLYLTPTGWDSQTAGGKEYHKISYKHHIHHWLENCIEKTQEYPMAYVGLKYYKQLITEHIIKQPSDNVIMLMKELLLKPENRIILKYMSEIEGARTPIRNKLRSDFFSSLCKQLNLQDRKFSLYANCDGILRQISISEIQNPGGCYVGIIFDGDHFVFQINELQTISFRIEYNWNNLWYGLTIRNKNGADVKDEYDHSNIDKIPCVKIINEKMNKKMNNNLCPLEDGWLSFIYFKNSKNLNFAADELNYDFAINMESIVNNFNRDVEEYLEAWKTTIDEIELSELS